MIAEARLVDRLFVGPGGRIVDGQFVGMIAEEWRFGRFLVAAEGIVDGLPPAPGGCIRVFRSYCRSWCRRLEERVGCCFLTFWSLVSLVEF